MIYAFSYSDLKVEIQDPSLPSGGLRLWSHNVDSGGWCVLTQKEPASRLKPFPILSPLSPFSHTEYFEHYQHFSPHRRRAGTRPTGKAAGWRSWRTGPTQTALAAPGNTPTRCIMWACTFLAGFAPSCPRQPCGWWRSPGMPTPIPEQGASVCL